jgi:signal peptidase I
MSERIVSAGAARRKPWLAAVLNFVWPGVGYLYAGSGRRALLLLLLAAPVGAAISLLPVVILVPLANIVIPVVLALALSVLVAYDAARAASAFNPDSPVPFFSRWYVCLAAVLLAGGLNLLWGPAAFVKAYTCQGHAMELTLLPGDRAWVAKQAHGWREAVLDRVVFDARGPKRGELIVFRYPKDRSVVFIKRLIGLPAETIEIRDKGVLINGAPLEEPYARFLRDASTRGNWGPQIVPADSYFVLGDNRDVSNDSPAWGFVPHEDLIGRAAVVYWSSDPQDGRVRWERMGSRLP